MIWNGETQKQFWERASDGIQCFALFPMQMESGQWVWLEKYWAASWPCMNGRKRWVRAIDRKGCVYVPIDRPPPPRPTR